MDVADDHKSRKIDRYWENLVAGETGIYKAEAIETLLATHYRTTGGAILDIGCGTSVIATTLRDRLKAKRLVFMDYDQAIIDEMRGQTADETIEWVVDDIFKIGQWDDRFDLVLLLDMIHEVYSFYGRPVREMSAQIDHERGQDAVRRALEQVTRIVNPGGGIIITDNVLSPANGPLLIKILTPEAQRAVRRFHEEYPSRKMKITWVNEDRLSITAHDFNILLTQYNKIKTDQEDRWNVERFEIHQYMSEGELRKTFEALGFTMNTIVGTPDGAAKEWRTDFEILKGASGLPEKRITLLAIKK